VQIEIEIGFGIGFAIGIDHKGNADKFDTDPDTDPDTEKNISGTNDTKATAIISNIGNYRRKIYLGWAG